MTARPKTPIPITGFSRYVTHKIFKDYNESARPELLQLVTECIARVNNRNNKGENKNSGVTPQAVKQTTKDGVEIKFTDINDVYIFLMELFADYNHDIGSIKLINQKLNAQNTHANINCSGLKNMDPRMLSFTKWLCKINWIKGSIKSKLVDLAKQGVYQTILIRSFGERGGKKISEYDFVKGVFEEYMLDGVVNEEEIKKLPFAIVKPDNVFDVVGDPSTRISFDQSSRSSGPLFYGALAKGYKFDVALPFLADKGASQTSNPLTEFFNKIKSFVSASGPNKNEIRKGLVDDLSKYIINDNETFPIRFSLNEEKFFEYTYSYGGGEIINMTFNTFGKTTMVGRSLSADNLKSNNTSVSRAIFKTATDLGMQMYAIAANSIYVSGDRAAGTIIMTLFHMWSKNLITLGGKLPRFVFEISTNTVLVPDERYFQMVQFKKNNGANVNKQKKNFLAYIYGLNNSGRLRIFEPGRGQIRKEYHPNSAATNYGNTPKAKSVNVPLESLGPAPGGNNGPNINNSNATSKPPKAAAKFKEKMKALRALTIARRTARIEATEGLTVGKPTSKTKAKNTAAVPTTTKTARKRTPTPNSNKQNYKKTKSAFPSAAAIFTAFGLPPPQSAIRPSSRTATQSARGRPRTKTAVPRTGSARGR